jgi:nitroimidazol reductase NimA-like FMN-containing flavoprotein (pyridoxamine 5'-phosphate oxidase superfamily)
LRTVDGAGPNEEARLSQTLGELDPVQVRQLLTAQHVGRVTCQAGARSCILAVKYRVSDAEHIEIETSDEACPGLAREQAPIRFEVDDVKGPSRWSTVIGWGFFEQTPPRRENDATYRIRFTDLRGFYRGALPVPAH